MQAEMNMDSWHSYPKIWALGHRAVQEIFQDPVLVEEKIDGSQFSFGRFGDELLIRSKGAVMNIDAPERMFNHAAETVKRIAPMLTNGWTYRGEYLQKARHNGLAYDRIPNQHVILFDINTGNECYLSAAGKAEEAERLGLECVPILYQGVVPDIAFFRTFLDRVSVLGGQKIEGVVVKNYARYTIDGKAMLGKFVSEAFKEIQSGHWREDNPTQTDVVDRLIEKFKTPARWGKSVQHLKEAGVLTNSPKDIGMLLKEVQKDTKAECLEEIKDYLAKWALPKIERGIIGGFAEWYKDELLKLQFDGNENSET